MKTCCQKEMQSSIKKHRDVVRCDTCGKLILAYGNDEDFQKIMTQLKDTLIPFEITTFGKLQIVIKDSTEKKK
jgi:hypothetical protein